jgi:hypothetical protein
MSLRGVAPGRHDDTGIVRQRGEQTPDRLGVLRFARNDMEFL